MALRKAGDLKYRMERTTNDCQVAEKMNNMEKSYGKLQMERLMLKFMLIGVSITDIIAET